MRTLDDKPLPLTDVLCGIVAATAPPKPSRLSVRRTRMRDVLGIGQRWYRLADGLVVRIVQVHRSDRLVEVEAVAPRAPGDPWTGARYAVSFTRLAEDYDQLVSWAGAR